MAWPRSSIEQVFNYDDAATYVAGIAAGIVTGGTPFAIKNEERAIQGLGGVGTIHAGMMSMDDLSVELTLTNDSKVFLGLGLPASATAAYDACSFAFADGEAGWVLNSGYIKGLEIKTEVGQEMTATVNYGALTVTKGATIASAALASLLAMKAHESTIQIGAANYGVQSCSIKVECPSKLYSNFDTGKASNVKRWPVGVKRVGMATSAEFTCQTWLDANTGDDSPIPGNLIVVGSDGSNTITLTLTMTAGICVAEGVDYTTDGIEVFKYSFTAPPNVLALAIT